MADIYVCKDASIEGLCRDMRIGLRVRRLTVALVAERHLLSLGKALLRSDCEDLGLILGCLYEKPIPKRRIQWGLLDDVELRLE